MLNINSIDPHLGHFPFSGFQRTSFAFFIGKCVPFQNLNDADLTNAILDKPLK